MKRIITPGTIPTRDLHQYIIGAIAPRPIAFVSSRDESGNDNLAPYSFFNAFSSNPPIVVFSSNRRVSKNTTKDTLHNIRANGELVINMVNYAMVRQMSIASAEYAPEVDEFEKSGLHKEAGELVAPPMVAEAPVNMECRVKDIIALGDQGGAGHLIICDVLKLHIDETVLDGDRIDPHKIDLMGRMGRTYYVRASGNAVSSIYQPVTDLPVGFDALPSFITNNSWLTGNEIAMIAGLTVLPDTANFEPDAEILKLDENEFYIRIKGMLQNGEAALAFLYLYKYYTL
ncbi:MAG: flavin reductase family protein [Saprospiraceae bacterium]|nr:flavin reductase family protein [Saprospiraceae bacterium]